MKPTRPGFYPIGVAYACTARTSANISMSAGTLGTLPLVYMFISQISIKFLHSLIITKFLLKVNKTSIFYIKSAFTQPFYNPRIAPESFATTKY